MAYIKLYFLYKYTLVTKRESKDLKHLLNVRIEKKGLLFSECKPLMKTDNTDYFVMFSTQ